MMTYLFLFLSMILLIFWAVNASGQLKDQGRFPILILSVTIVFLLTLIFLNNNFPYAGGGDDENYYHASLKEFHDLSDWFDLAQFQGMYEQVGYPLLLRWLNQVSDTSLYIRKSLNLLFFIGLVIVWFSIGKIIGGRKVAYAFGVGVLLSTPLWFYWMFLFKDMTIVLLQSVFLLGIIRYFGSKKNIGVSLFLMAISTILLIPFRVQLIVMNVVLFAMSFVLQLKNKKKASSSWIKIVLGLVLMIVVLRVGTDASFLQSFGVSGYSRSMSVEDLQSTSGKYMARGRWQGIEALYFPILYLIGETNALNPQAWKIIDPSLLRGLSGLPWMMVGVPLFLVGSKHIIKNRKRRKQLITGGTPEAMPIDPAIESSNGSRLLLILMGFVLLYAAVSWIVGDTTRWRMPAFPAMAAIAGWGWVSLKPGKRMTVLFFWAFLCLIFIVLYYTALKFVIK